MATREDMLRNLLALSTPDFQTLVEKNLDRTKQPQLWDLLLSPYLVRRTCNVLAGAVSDVESQLAERRADMESYRQECHGRGADGGRAEWFEAEGEHQEWRRRALGYRRMVNRRLREAKAELGNATAPPRPPDAARKVRQMETVFRLAWAIHHHRASSLEQGVIPDGHDVELWRCLDQIPVETATDGQMPVARFLKGVMADSGFEPPNNSEEVA